MWRLPFFINLVIYFNCQQNVENDKVYEKGLPMWHLPFFINFVIYKCWQFNCQQMLAI